MKKIFLTGVTGLLAPFLMLELLKDEQNEIHLLIRNMQDKTPESRLREILKTIQHEKLADQIGSRIKIYEGDITSENLGLKDQDYKKLTNSIDEIFHCAANTDFSNNIQFMRQVNVKGTERIIHFGFNAMRNGKKIRMHHVSTTYVAGHQKAPMRFYENQLNIGQAFNNTYEQTKYESELLVETQRKKGMPISVFRISILAGESRTGIATSLKSIYYLLQLLFTECFSVIPLDESSKNNIISVDEAAVAIKLVINGSFDENGTYHIANNHELNFEFFVECASKYFGFKIPRFVNSNEFDQVHLSAIQRKMLGPFAPYINNKISFDISKTQAAIRNKFFSFTNVDERYLKNIFGYCESIGFSKRKTVFNIS